MRIYNIQVPDLLGKTFGSWRVLAFEGVRITAQRGTRGGKRADGAKRAFWLCECVVCGTRHEFRTDYVMGGHVHQPCRRKFRTETKNELLRDIAAVFGTKSI